MKSTLTSDTIIFTLKSLNQHFKELPLSHYKELAVHFEVLNVFTMWSRLVLPKELTVHFKVLNVFTIWSGFVLYQELTVHFRVIKVFTYGADLLTLKS